MGRQRSVPAGGAVLCTPGWDGLPLLPTHLRLPLGSYGPCYHRAGAGDPGAASLGSWQPGLCCCRCTCRRATAYAPTPCRAAAGQSSGHHLSCGRLAQSRGVPGGASLVSVPVPGSGRSNLATDTAARAPRPWRSPAVVPRYFGSPGTLRRRKGTAAEPGCRSGCGADAGSLAQLERGRKGPQVGSGWQPRPLGSLRRPEAEGLGERSRVVKRGLSLPRHLRLGTPGRAAAMGIWICASPAWDARRGGVCAVAAS